MSDLWPADRVERRPVSELLPYAKNARLHSDDQIAQIARSIEEFGWTMAVLLDEGGQIIAGHGRVLAAQKLGIESVPTMVARGWTEAQQRLYRLTDNKLALNASWDSTLLAIDMEEMKALGADLGVTGFSEIELRQIMLRGNTGLTDPDDLPASKTVKRRARTGDVWTLGSHRLKCGDATSARDVRALLAGAEPSLMVTDPPYGVSYDPQWRDGHDENMGKHLGAKGMGRSLGKVTNDDRADWSEAWALFEGDVAYVWHGGLHSHTVAANLISTGLVLRAQIVWAKQLQVFGRGNYHWQHEPCWYAVRRGSRANWYGGRKQTTLWEIANNNPLGGGGELKTGHSTQKPVECMRRPIENNSVPGDVVYDPFVGSGTTIMAAEMTARACYAMELSPEYVDIALARWEAFTGKKATCERSKAKANAAKGAGGKPRQAPAKRTRTKSSGRAAGAADLDRDARAAGDLAARARKRAARAAAKARPRAAGGVGRRGRPASAGAAKGQRVRPGDALADQGPADTEPVAGDRESAS